MTAAAGNTPAAVVIDKNVNVDVSVKESLVNEKAKDTTGKGFSIKRHPYLCFRCYRSSWPGNRRLRC